MSIEVETKSTQTQIMTMAQEKVLIKKQVLTAFKYKKSIIQYAKKKSNDLYQHAQESVLQLHKTAYQQGYDDGIKQLLHNFIATLEHSEITFQEQVNQSQKKLENLLMVLFDDDRLKEIVAHYFAQKSKMTSKITLHLPANMQSNLNITKQNITILSHTDYGSIALESNNQIYDFSPSIATKNTLPQIFSIPTRCQILNERKIAYQKLIEKIHTENPKNEDTGK
ncbi:hypothetical protein ABN063_15955 [Providencia vermicola]|uniref:hypothetical protein n=1 Tax=Providencia vermicola TaxID=333965 RepID=UPI0032DB0BBD